MGNLDISSAASSIEVKSTQTDAGAGVFATNELVIGEAVIAVKRPLLAALDAEQVDGVCYQCYRRQGDVPVETMLGFETTDMHATSAKLSRCAGCKSVWYCGKACQKTSWNDHHSLECPMFRAVHPRVLPNHTRAVLRLILLQRAGRIQIEDWKALMACSTHAVEYAQKDRREELAQLSQMTKMLMSFLKFEIDEVIILDLFMKLQINSITLQTPFHDPLGLALHPLLAKINHSCDPNCYVRFPTSGQSPGSIVITPLRLIRAGEEVTIPYTDPTMPVRLRQYELKRRYFFHCHCHKCTLDKQQEDELDLEFRERLHNLEDQAQKTLDQPTVYDTVDSQASTVKALLSQIQALFANNADWSLIQYPFPQLLHQTVLAFIDAQDFSSAFRLTAVLYQNVDAYLYPSTVHPTRLVHTLLLLRMAETLLDPELPRAINTRLNTTFLPDEVDLGFWHYFLLKRFILETSRTWKEQPWPLLRQRIDQVQLQTGCTDRMAEKEQKRLETLCDKTIDALKRGYMMGAIT